MRMLVYCGLGKQMCLSLFLVYDERLDRELGSIGGVLGWGR